jgi:hypothetical protein
MTLPAGSYWAVDLIKNTKVGGLVVGKDGALPGYPVSVPARASVILELVKR